jgi:hypothetical protein
MEKSFHLNHIGMNDDNYQSEAPAIPRTYNTVNTLFNKANEYIA